MSFDLGKKLAMGGFVIAIIVGLIQTFSIHSIWLEVPTALMVAAGFALMWYTSGNILYMAIGAAYIIGYVLGYIFPANGAFGSLIIFVIVNLYLLIWAFKRFSGGDMMGAIILGGIFLLSFAIRLALVLLTDIFGSIYGILAIISLIIPVLIAAAKAYMVFTETEK